MKRFGIVCTLFGAALLPPACALETNDGSDVPSLNEEALDAISLETALGNQAKLEGAGFELLGRVWFSPDAYGELYRDPAGGTMGVFSARGASEEARRTELKPALGETFEEYATRAAGGHAVRPLELATSSDGKDAIAFDPMPRSAGLTGTSTEAIVNELCPLATFDMQCGSHYRYGGSTSSGSWRVHDLTALKSIQASGVSYDTFVCADKKAATIAVTPNNTSFTQVTLDVPEGRATGLWAASQWFESEVCVQRILWCVDYEYRINFPRANFTFAANSRSGGNYHYCGSVWDHGQTSSNAPDYHCDFSRSCPWIETPAEFGRQLCLSQCGITCSQSCAGVPPVAQGACQQSCGSQCGAGC